jgi:uncharacterized protein YceH (UPF0502 family)
MPAQLSPPLDDIEIRVLGALIEKEIATPEYYPLSLNALTNACNQKTNREPVASYEDEEVRAALDRLRARGLAFVRTGAGSRVEKFGHRVQEQLNFGRGELALLDVLMLRGPQTLGELRDRTERMHRFEDLEQVERSLRVLGEWNGQQLVKQLPRHPGSKEPRWVQLLGGEPSSADLEGPSATRSDRLSALETEVRVLQDELAALKAEFESFRRQF